MAPRDVDVTDGRIIEKRLEPGKAMESVEHCGADGVFVGLVHRGTALGVGGAGETAQLITKQLASESPLVSRRESAPP